MQKDTGMNTGTVSYGKKNQKCSRGVGLMQTTEEPIGSGTNEEHAESRALPRIARHKCGNWDMAGKILASERAQRNAFCPEKRGEGMQEDLQGAVLFYL